MEGRFLAKNEYIFCLMSPVSDEYAENVGYFIIYLLEASSSVNHTGSPRGFSLNFYLTDVENNTKHVHFTNLKHINIIRKLVPSVLLS